MTLDYTVYLRINNPYDIMNGSKRVFMVLDSKLHMVYTTYNTFEYNRDQNNDEAEVVTGNEAKIMFLFL